MPLVPFVIPSLVETPEGPDITLIPCYIPALVDGKRRSVSGTASGIDPIEFDAIGQQYQTAGSATSFNRISGVSK